jgi:hypothetical protein
VLRLVRREAEEDLGDEVVVQRAWRRRHGAGAVSSWSGWGMGKSRRRGWVGPKSCFGPGRTMFDAENLGPLRSGRKIRPRPGQGAETPTRPGWAAHTHYLGYALDLGIASSRLAEN